MKRQAEGSSPKQKEGESVMRILFVLDSVEAPAAANPRLGRRLAAALAQIGHSVTVLELWDGAHTPPETPGCRAVLLPFSDEAAMEAALEHGAAHGSPLPLRLARLAARPAAAAAAFRQFALKQPRRVTATRRKIEELDRETPFDAVCAVAAPYRAAFALEGAAIAGRKLLWQMDPYAANTSYRAPGGYERERALLTAMDHVWITEQAAPDFAPGGPLAALAGKAQVLAFPNLVPSAAVAEVDVRRCVFCGTLYPGLREPGALLQLFQAVGGDWTLTMAGGGWAAFGRERAAAEAALGGRFTVLGPVAPAEAARLEASAGVLVSIGNQAANQLPSKLYEYIAAGKPLLHLAAGPDDAALGLLRRWPLALALDPGAPDAADTLRAWLEKNAGRTLPFSEAAARFPENTPAAVAETFVQSVAALCAKA